VVTWWHAAAPERLATDALGVIADRRITDSTIAEQPTAALKVRAEDYAPGDTDLSWTRTTAWRAVLASTLDSIAGRRGDAVQVRGGRVEGDPNSATAALLAGWLSVRCGCSIKVVKSTRHPGSSGVDGVILQLDQDEEVQVHADRRGGAVITQPFRPDSPVALPERVLGDLLGEELRRLDRDEPFMETLETATGITGLAGRSPVREHIWVDPMEADGPSPRAKKKAAAAAAPESAAPESAAPEEAESGRRKPRS
jgi:glucose-6-phosphate dehydrogenase assembly protein OpcA